MGKRDFVAEIQHKRSRDRLHPVIAPTRLGVVQASFEKVKNDQELLRYFPVALAAIVESFVRKAVQELVDGLPPVLDRLLVSNMGKDQKFDLSILRAVGGKQISVGELAAHLVPIKSLANVDTVMSTVLGQSFLDALRSVPDRWAVEVEGKPSEPIIPDLDAVLSSLAKMYDHRHILAHEDAEGFELSADTIAAEIQAVAAFLAAAAEVVSNTLYPGAPLTQGAMNQSAAEAAQRSSDELERQLVMLRSHLSPTMQAALDRSQEAWVAYREAQASLEGLAFEGGSMQPMIEAGAFEALTKGRVDALQRVSQDDPDWPLED